MTEIECPTCERRFEITRELGLGDKLECPECGELLRVVSLDPVEVEYWEDTEDESDLNAAEDDLLDVEEDYVKRLGVEDEENEAFELPGKSTLIDEIDEEKDDVWEEESGESD